MKLTAIFLLACALQVGAKGYSQSVTLSLKDAPLEKVFTALEKQTGYYFTYTRELLQGTKPIDLDVRNASLKEVLAICFKDQPVTYEIIDKAIIIKQEVQKKISTDFFPSPPIDVRGRVVDDNGQPVQGAIVTVKGTNRRTATDTNGEFILPGIDASSILVVSAVNIETYEIKVAGKPDLTVNVKVKVTTGEEVLVNTGYQKLKPNQINGSVVLVDNKTFNEQVGTTVLDRLNNVTSGLVFNPGKSESLAGVPRKTSISIRGISTIEASLDPIIVLDNFIYDGDINNINPNDVENITILKDAAATSIYGAQGGNGVIVITTKRGRFNQKLKVSFTSNIIISQKPDLFALPQMSVADYINTEQFLFERGYFDNTIIANSPKLALTPAVEIFLKRRNGSITAADSLAQINTLKGLDTRNDYDRYFNKSGVTQQYSLNLTGGSGNIAWLIGAGYDKSLSASNLNDDRITARFTNSYKPLKNLTLSLGAYYTSSVSGGSMYPGYQSPILINGRQVSYLQFADATGNALPLASTYRADYIDTFGQGKLLDWKYYPLENYKHVTTSNKGNSITTNIGLNYQFQKNLQIDISYQYQHSSFSSDRLSDRESFESRNIVNTFSELTRNSLGSVIQVSNKNMPPGGILDITKSSQHSQNFRVQLNYRGNWKQFEISAIAGSEVRESVSDPTTFTKIYGYNKDPLTYGTVDFKNSYPTVFQGTASISGAPTVGPEFTYRFVSQFANASISYKQRYTFSLSARKDGANIFGAATNDKWKPLWSAGLGWEVSKEKFYKFPIIPYLRLRGTLGYSGNVDIRKTPYPIEEFATDPYSGFPSGRVTLNDPRLRWEKSRMLNIGVDFSSKHQEFSGSIEYYRRNVKDLYGLVPLDYTTGGLQYIKKNIANMRGEGVDLSLNSKILTKIFKWNAGLLINYSSDKVTSYFTNEAKSIYTLINGSGGNVIIPVVGKPVYAIAAYKWGGLNSNGDPQGYLNGQLSTAYDSIQDETQNKDVSSIRYVGPSTPPVFGSIQNEFRWKGFSASFNISFRFGYYFRKAPLDYSLLFSKGKGNADFANRWKKPGDELFTNIPAMIYTDYQINGQPAFNSRNDLFALSEINVLKADNVRLQYINLGYTFTPRKTNHLIEQLQLFANVANLGIIWRANKEKIDPDNPFQSTPISKSFTLGIRASFK